MSYSPQPDQNVGPDRSAMPIPMQHGPPAGAAAVPWQHPQAGPDRRQTAAVGPGWPARILYATSIVVSHIPGFLTVILFSTVLASGRPTYIGILTATFGIIGLVLGAVGLMLARATTWARRGIAVGVFVVVTIIALVTPMLVSSTAMQLTMDYRLVFRLQLIAGYLGATLALAVLLIAWCIVRNRRWWVLLVAAGLAVVVGGVSALINFVTVRAQIDFALGNLISQTSVLILIAGSFVILHLLGRTATGTSAVAIAPTVPAAPGGGYPQTLPPAGGFPSPAPGQSYDPHGQVSIPNSQPPAQGYGPPVPNGQPPAQGYGPPPTPNPPAPPGPTGQWPPRPQDPRG